MPSRKRAKPNPATKSSDLQASNSSPQGLPLPPATTASDGGGASQSEILQSEQLQSSDESREISEASVNSKILPGNRVEGTSTPNSTKSWYGGAWPLNPKAASVAQIASESILSTGETLAKAATNKKLLPGQSNQIRPALAHYLSPRGSSRSLPLTGKTTKLNVSATTSDQSPKSEEPTLPEQSDDHSNPAVSHLGGIGHHAEGEEVQGSKVNSFHDSAHNQSTWAKWFTKSETPSLPTLVPQDSNIRITGESAENKTEAGVSGTADICASKQPETTSVERRNSDQGPRIKRKGNSERPVPPTSWLGLLGASRYDSKEPRGQFRQGEDSFSTPSPNSVSSEQKPVAVLAKDNAVQSDITSGIHSSTGRGSGWAFWSKGLAGTGSSYPGQLAVAGSSSEYQPQDAIVEPKGVPKLTSTLLGKRTRPISLEERDEATRKSLSALDSNNRKGDQRTAESSTTSLALPTSTSRKQAPKNLLLPLFEHTYAITPEVPSFLQQISYFFYRNVPQPKHSSLLKEPPRIRKALAIGVHGYFPMPIIQTVLGRPTGTSIKFAESAAIAIHKFCEIQGYEIADVEKIALEGEGKIEERLDLLWKLLLNWIDKIRQADFILVACHSQGVPVAVSLVAKLIGFGCVNGARIGICAMAGINLGPFVEYKSRWIGGSAGELFDFANSESSVSKGYEDSLDTALRFGAKVIYVGSLDDQLVSLQSSTFGTVQHPNIYRAAWIDGRVHAPDFLTHLVGFVLKLRNLGVLDHGLIRELSNPLAGSLVGGEGHSRIYEDTAVYNLAVDFTMKTSSLNSERLEVDRSATASTQNPYILPFAMRGLLEEDFVRKELFTETLELLKQFDDWKPSTKVLRDVKYRLEGIRSKL